MRRSGRARGATPGDGRAPSRARQRGRHMRCRSADADAQRRASSLGDRPRGSDPATRSFAAALVCASSWSLLAAVERDAASKRAVRAKTGARRVRFRPSRQPRTRAASQPRGRPTRAPRRRRRARRPASSTARRRRRAALRRGLATARPPRSRRGRGGRRPARGPRATPRDSRPRTRSSTARYSPHTLERGGLFEVGGSASPRHPLFTTLVGVALATPRQRLAVIDVPQNPQ
jgi:hypothetical protein